MIMERSSETSWQQPFGSRRRDTSTSSDQNLRLLHASRISLSADTSHNSVLGTGRKAREQIGQSPSDHLRNWINASGEFEDQVVVYPLVHRVEFGDVSLRQWLDNPERAVDAIECLHIFRQIVEIVSAAHSQGIVVNNIRPSCFVMSSFNHVSFIESASCSDSGSDSLEDGLNNQNMETNRSSPPTSHDLPEWKSRPGSKESPLMSEMSCLQSTSAWGMHLPSEVERGEYETKDCGNLEQAEEKKHTFPMKEVLVMETSWYTSPEEIAGAQSSCASDIYRLGVLLFELFCTFSSIQEKSRTMASLRHRVLPPQLLLKWPKEASFCLWLLHPDPCSRPKMGELLQSEFLNEPRHDIEEREAAIELREKIEEQELLLEFLVLIRQNKQEAANKLHDTISFLSTDIKEIVNKQRALREKRGATLQIHNTAKGDLLEDESHNSEMATETQNNLLFKNTRLMKNFKELESAYLLTRHKQPARQSRNPLTGRSPTSSNSRGSVVLTERSVNNSSHKEILDEDGESGWISPFLEGLCKYLSFNKLKVKADLKHGDLLNSSNLVCCVTFDRDGEFFATAGVNKKIKVFEYGAILNEDRDIHYPVVEMTSRSKLSSICWNSYIKSQIASSNFEGTVQVWDATRSQVFMELREHERRVWSVDFSSADPTILASGSDDGSVKLWSINQGTSIGTIRAKANVCCVQFPVDSGHSLAFGSADHRVYYYDLRSPRVPLCTLVGHNRTVSYIKFIDSTNLVSASTDNTLKLWDLSMSTSRVLDTPLQSFTGHTNVKNFVGLSTWDGYIATGSETNEVFVYHKAFPMPALSFKFNSIDPLTGTEMDDTSQFISSVCWRGNSSTLVAANSTGDVKLLEMV